MDKYPPCIRSKPKRLVFLIGPVDSEPDFHQNAIRLFHSTLNESTHNNQKHEEVPYHFHSVPIDHSFPAKKPPKDMPSTDGILKYNWTSKHFESIPSVIIYFATFSVDWSAAEWNRRENMIQERYHRLKSIVSIRDIKIILVLIRIGTNALDKDIIDDRLNVLKKHVPSDHKSFYYLTIADFFHPDHPLMKRLLKSTKEYSHYYYINQIKHFKSLEKLINEKFKGYLYHVLAARYQFKIAFLQEFVINQYTAGSHNSSSFASSPLGSLAAGMGGGLSGGNQGKEHNVALKYYLQAYHSLRTALETIDVALYEQVIAVAEVIHVKILLLLLGQYQALDEAFQQFQLHLASFAGGCRLHPLPYQHAHWMSDQYVVFAELLQGNGLVPMLIPSSPVNSTLPSCWYALPQQQQQQQQQQQNQQKQQYDGRSEYLRQQTNSVNTSYRNSMSMNTTSGKSPATTNNTTSTTSSSLLACAKDLSFYYANAARYLIQRDLHFQTFVQDYLQAQAQQAQVQEEESLFDGRESSFTSRESSVASSSVASLSAAIAAVRVPSSTFPSTGIQFLPSLPVVANTNGVAGSHTLEEYLLAANLEEKIILPPKYVGSTVQFVDPLNDLHDDDHDDEDDEDHIHSKAYQLLYRSYLIHNELLLAKERLGKPAAGSIQDVHDYSHQYSIAYLSLALQAIPVYAIRRQTLLLIRLMEEYLRMSTSQGRIHWEKVYTISKHCLEVYLHERWDVCVRNILPIVRDSAHVLLTTNPSATSDCAMQYLTVTVWLFVYYQTLFASSIPTYGEYWMEPSDFLTKKQVLPDRMEGLYNQIIQLLIPTTDKVTAVLNPEGIETLMKQLVTLLPSAHATLPSILRPSLPYNTSLVSNTITPNPFDNTVLSLTSSDSELEEVNLKQNEVDRVLIMHNDPMYTNSLFVVDYAFHTTTSNTNKQALELGQHLVFELKVTYKGLQSMICERLEVICNDGHLGFSITHQPNDNQITSHPVNLTYNHLLTTGNDVEEVLLTDLTFVSGQEKVIVLDIYLTETRFHSLLIPESVLYLEQLRFHHPSNTNHVNKDATVPLPLQYHVYVQPGSFFGYFHHITSSNVIIGQTANTIIVPGVHKATSNSNKVSVEGTIGGNNSKKAYVNVKASQIEDYLHYTSLAQHPMTITTPDTVCLPRKDHYLTLSKPTRLLTSVQSTENHPIVLFEGIEQRINVLFTVCEHDLVAGSQVTVTVECGGPGGGVEVMQLGSVMPVVSEEVEGEGEEVVRYNGFPVVLSQPLLAHHTYSLPLFLTPRSTSSSTTTTSTTTEGVQAVSKYSLQVVLAIEATPRHLMTTSLTTPLSLQCEVVPPFRLTYALAPAPASLLTPRTGLVCPPVTPTPPPHHLRLTVRASAHVRNRLGLTGIGITTSGNGDSVLPVEHQGSAEEVLLAAQESIAYHWYVPLSLTGTVVVSYAVIYPPSLHPLSPGLCPPVRNSGRVEARMTYPLPVLPAAAPALRVQVTYPGAGEALRQGTACRLVYHLLNPLPAVQKILFVAYLNDHFLCAGNTLHLLEMAGQGEEELSLELVPIRSGWLSCPRVTVAWQRDDGNTVLLYDTGEQEQHRPRLFVQPHSFPSQHLILR